MRERGVADVSGDRAKFNLADMHALVGQEIGLSSWIRVDQAMIDQFAECTGDRQWIHVDTDRAAREAPAGTTIAHGFLTLSLLPVMSYEIGGIPEGIHASFNYGLDKLRFLAPVRAGVRVRLRATLTGFDEKEPGRYLMRRSNVVEIEGEEKPALIADTLALLVTKEAS
jgi:acyl dehydratase